MIAALLLACPAPAFTTGQATSPGLAQDEPVPVAFPFVTRSPLVQRALPGARGLRVRLAVPAEDVRVVAVSHPADHQVLVAEGRPFLVGPPTLPRRAVAASHPGRDLLPELARRDGIGARVHGLSAGEPPAGLTTVAIGRDVRIGSVPEGIWLDQLFFAAVAPVPEGTGVPLEVLEALEAIDLGGAANGLGLELRVAAPPAAEADRTWTLLVTPLPGADAKEAAAPRSTPDEVAGFLRDVADEIGAACVHFEGPDEQLDIRPTMGPGVAWGDVDADGWQDLYLVQGGGRAGSEPPSNRLLQNRGDGSFEDATAERGGGDVGAGMGALFLDVDGDARLDLYVANYGADVLYRNDSGRLADVSGAAGVGGDLWSAGVAASDFDRDGDLDLYVTSYLLYDESLMPGEEGLGRYRREDPIAMLPFAFPGQRNVFLRNDSDAEGPRFADVSAELGLLDGAGRGMQPIFWDFDRDGDDDLYVANDVSYNVLWRNEGDGSFRDVSFMTGMDDPRGGMGVAVGDVDLDGDEDLFLTNWELEANALYRNNLLSHTSQRTRVATFRDVIVPSGLGRFGVGATSWGAELFDADNDGDLDLFVANGYTSPDYESTGICVGQPNHFFWNDGEGKFTDGAADAGAALARRLPSRSAVGCDYDRDGDVDLVVTANNGPVQLLRNELPADAKGHWLVVRLRGQGKNTHGIGAEVSVRTRGPGGRLLRRSLRAGTSYLAGNPAELHFGLGEADGIESLVVRWPSGRESTHAALGVDRTVTLDEPE